MKLKNLDLYKKTNLVLILFLAILVIIFFIGINNLKYKDSSNKYVTSALLNPKYLTQIKVIQFNENLFIKKINEQWIVESEGNKFPADTNKIEEMLKNFIKTIKMYKKTYNKNTKQTNNCIFFYTSLDIFSNSQSVSALTFGQTDFTNSKIDIINLKNNQIYQTENYFSDYINPSVEFFIRKDFIPENVSKDSSKIQEIIIQDFAQNKIFVLQKSNKNELESFYKKLNQILLLRSDDLQINLIDEISKLNPVVKVQLELGNNTTAGFSVYKFDNKYFVLTQDNLIFGISDWTYNRIVE